MFIDPQKVFGTVNLKILSTKLEHYGIVSRMEKNWFKSFLIERYHLRYHLKCVKVKPKLLMH